MVAFIEEHRERFGVEPICRELLIAPSTYYEHRARLLDPTRLPARTRRDAELEIAITRVHEDSFETYGARKIWHELRREKKCVARCTVERLMRKCDIRGVTRSKSLRTTTPAREVQPPQDLVERRFKAAAPNQLWVADFTFVPLPRGFAFVAFVLDVFSRLIVGWQVGSNMRTDLVLAALEQALAARDDLGQLVHHSDHGSQYLSLLYSQRLAAAGVRPSAGSIGDSYDNAMAESLMGLYKTELIRRQRSWSSVSELEYATLKWVHWYNNRRLHSSIGNVPPQEFEEQWYSQQQGRLSPALHT